MRFSFVDAASQAYCLNHSIQEPEHLKRLTQLTIEHEGEGEAFMLVNPLQGATLQQFVHVTGAKNILEIGCFTGYSAGWMAEGLIASGADKQGGFIHTVELGTKRAKFAQDYINESGRGHLIKVLNMSGNDALASFPDGTKFDLVFIDADKPGYIGYVKTLLDRNMISPNGVILADNVTFSGLVPKVDPQTGKVPQNVVDALSEDEAYFAKLAEALAKFNDYIHSETRVSAVLLPLFDGLYVIKPKLA
ncbi:S-adenosyl-L-methionine-dependent methyltransferase [Ramicandelaber brevisporus]|nr:S-adenosyl-L-methionine-dependent methyltransferase [Ramicandelaber brevisporus]